MTTPIKFIRLLTVLSVLFWGACTDVMAAQNGEPLPELAALQRNGAVPVDQPCPPQSVHNTGPEAAAAVNAMLPPTPLQRLLYILMLLRHEQTRVAHSKR